MDSVRRAAPESRVARETAPPRRVETRRPEIARVGIRAVPAPRDEMADFTTPPLWTTVRLKIYEQLPSSTSDLGFTYTVVPMTITGASETTAPGLGLSGTF